MRTRLLHINLSPFIARAQAFRLDLRTTALWGMFLCLCLTAPLGALAQMGEWRWMGGSSTVPCYGCAEPGLSGTQGVYAAGNVPGGRNSAVSWSDASGNFWLFAGAPYDNSSLGALNDLWEYNPSAGQWRWMDGSNTEPCEFCGQPGLYGTQDVYAADNVPGARQWAISWSDASGDLWLFGGWGYDSTGNYGNLNDLWEYNPSAGQWRWMGGNSAFSLESSGSYYAPGVYGTQGVYAADNVPGGRNSAVSWTDASGNLWLFGGTGFDSAGDLGWLSDLWEYNPSTGQWRWMGGSSTGNQSGVSGTQGVYAAGNVPGGRGFAIGWSDGSGNFWLFGGYGSGSTGNLGFLDDLWEYSPSTGQWRWMSGSTTLLCNDCGQPGVYGTQGIYAAGNVPGSRDSAVSWLDGSGNLWLFGGWGFDSASNLGWLNDLWEYNPSLGKWRWMGGGSTNSQPGVYGTQGVYAAGNVPGGTGNAVTWSDGGGNLWLFGGDGYDSTGNWGLLNDLWEYSPPAESLASPSITSADSATFVVGTTSWFPVTASGNPVPTLSESGALPNGVTFDASTGVLSGTPAAGTEGEYPIIFTASNGVSPDAIQSFTLTVDAPPVVITSAGSATFIIGAAGSFSVTATGDPAPTLNESGALPSGMTFNASTGVLSGTPAAGTAGSYPIIFTASNGVSPDAAQSFTLLVQPALAQTGEWRWMDGSSTIPTSCANSPCGPPGMYGTQGVYAAGNVPGGRGMEVSWSDASGNLWLFGGLGYDSADNEGYLNDLWEYNPATGQWRWMSGSSTVSLQDSNGLYYAPGVYGTQGVYAAGNVPGGRQTAISWSDGSGNLWLFGGLGYDSTGAWGSLNDLWEYSPSTGQWRWVSGSSTVGINLGQLGVYGTEGVYAAGNVPGGISDAVGWSDASGNFWLFGGEGYDSAGNWCYLNVLWEYNPSIGQWRWMGGSSTLSLQDSYGYYYTPGVYGTQGVYAAGNVPGSRSDAAGWSDGSGNFWLFGGWGYDSTGNLGWLNDLWEYNPAVGQWRWMGGSSTLSLQDAYGTYYAPTVYGTPGVYAAGNVLGSRQNAVSWSDASSNVWLFGGGGVDSTGNLGDLNDLWEYNPSTGQWRWMDGSSTVGNIGAQPGVYGTQGSYAAGNVPGGRSYAVSWSDASGNLWLFGGAGPDSTGNGGWLNDLWEYNPAVAPPAITSAGGATFAVGTAGSFTVTATGTPAPVLSESGALPNGITFNAATGVLSGTPEAGPPETYSISFRASNGIIPDAVQNFALTVTAKQGAATVNYSTPSPASIPYGTVLVAKQMKVAVTVEVKGKATTITGDGTISFTDTTPVAGQAVTTWTAADTDVVLPAGSHAIVATWTPSASYSQYGFGYSGAQTITVNPYAPVLTFKPTSGTQYPQSFAGTNILMTTTATATVAGSKGALAGTWAFSDACTPVVAGTPCGGTLSTDGSDRLPAGSHVITASFTPADTNDYTAGAVSKTISVKQGKLSFTGTVAGPTTLVYGTGLPPALFNAVINHYDDVAKAEVPESASNVCTNGIVYTDSATGSVVTAGEVLPAGSYTIDVSCTSSDANDYPNPAVAKEKVKVTPLAVASLLTFQPAAMEHGTTTGAAQTTAAVAVANNPNNQEAIICAWSFSPPEGTLEKRAGTVTVKATCTPQSNGAADPNYTKGTLSATLSVQ